MGETRQWEQGVGPLLVFSLVWGRTNIDAEHAPYKDAFFEVMVSASLLFHNMESVNGFSSRHEFWIVNNFNVPDYYSHDF